MRISEDGKTLLKVLNEDIPEDGHFEIPAGITSIAERAFYCCTYMVSVDIPPSVKKIGNGAFQCCTQLMSVVIPDGVTMIDMNAFSSCRSLMRVILPKELVTIGLNAFGACGMLQSIDIPPKLQSIGSLAFDGCGSLQLITIPESVIAIGVRGFNNNPNVHSIVILTENDKDKVRITNLFPADMRNKIVPFELADKASRECKDQLARIVRQPEIHPLYRFFQNNVRSGFNVTNENTAVSLRRALPDNIFMAMNPFASNDSIYMQKAQTRMLRVPLPKSQDELQTYKIQMEEIASDCIRKATEFNTFRKQDVGEKRVHSESLRVI